MLKNIKIWFKRIFSPLNHHFLTYAVKAQGKIAVNILQFFFCYLIFLVLLVIFSFAILKEKDNVIIMEI